MAIDVGFSLATTFSNRVSPVGFGHSVPGVDPQKILQTGRLTAFSSFTSNSTLTH